MLTSIFERAGVAFLLLVALFLAYGYHLSWRWIMRTIPGPRPSFLWGNMEMMNIFNIVESQKELPKVYGPVMKYFMGKRPFILVTDPDLIEQVSVSQFSAFHDRPVPNFYNAMNDDDAEKHKWEISWAKGTVWSSIRKAMDPLAQPTAIKEYMPDIHAAANNLIHTLNPTTSTSVAILEPLYTWSLHVLLTTIMGVEFSAKGAHDVKALQKLEENMRLAMHPKCYCPLYNISCMMLPDLRSWIARLAGRWGMSHPFFFTTVKALSYSDGASDALLQNARKAAGKGEGLDYSPKRAGRVSLPVTKVKLNGELEGWHDFKDKVPSPNSFYSRSQDVEVKEPGKESFFLTDLQIRYQGSLLMLAGFESTSLTAGYCLYELARHQAAQEKVRQEVAEFLKGKPADVELSYSDLKHFTYTTAVVDEVLRMYPPAASHLNVLRNADKDMVLGGHRIPAGVPVVLNAFGLHYNEKYFPEPEKFRPERFLKESKDGPDSRPKYSYIPFGAGPRRCLGQRFALTEILLSIIAVIRKFRFSLDPEHHPPGSKMQFETLWIVKPRNGIWLRMQPV